MYMYEMLGMNKMVLSMWKTVHMSWQFKSNFGSGSREAMRLTGQATTALGNVITNLVVHAQFVCDNYQKIKGILMLGDDGLFMCSSKPDLSKQE